MVKDILITRPKEDAEETAALLRQVGYSICISPVMQIKALPWHGQEVQDCSGLIITSANALPAIQNAKIDKNTPFFIVGQRSAERLAALGFTNIKGPVRQSSELPALIAPFIMKEQSRYLHLTSAHGEKEFYAALRKAGASISPINVYESVEENGLTDEAAKKIAAAQIGAVLFYSPRSATLFLGLLKKHGLLETTATMAAFCLSPAVAGVLGACAFSSVHIAAVPTQESLFDCLALKAF